MMNTKMVPGLHGFSQLSDDDLMKVDGGLIPTGQIPLWYMLLRWLAR